MNGLDDAVLMLICISFVLRQLGSFDLLVRIVKSGDVCC